MARVFGLIFGVLLVASGLVVSELAHAGIDASYSQSAAESYCNEQLASYGLNDGRGECRLVGRTATGTPDYCRIGSATGPTGTDSAGGYEVVVISSGAVIMQPQWWCVANECPAGSGYWAMLDGQNRNGATMCDDGCQLVFDQYQSVGKESDPTDGYTAGFLRLSGERCITGLTAGVIPVAPKLQPASPCKAGEMSCVNPKQGFCAASDSGEWSCVGTAPDAGSPTSPDGPPSGCATGATGSVCIGGAQPSDPPIAPGTPPSRTDTYDLSSGSGSGGSSTTIIVSGYSGTSPGDGNGQPGPPSGSSAGAGSASNQSGSGNSPGAGGHGTDPNGKCPDGSVPTASGCSGTATDGGCDTPPQCFGDAVLCASFKEQVAIRCNTRPGSSSSSGGYGDPSAALAAAGVPADGGASSDPSASGLVTSSDLGEDGFDASGLGFSRSCPANPTFSVLGHSYTLDLGPFCNFAGMLSWFVLLCASLVGLRIVASGRA